jgi:hypothetical protein
MLWGIQYLPNYTPRCSVVLLTSRQTVLLSGASILKGNLTNFWTNAL